MYSSSSSSSSSSMSYIKDSIPKSYKVLEILGQGGFGQVVKCVRRGTEHTVAIKISRDSFDLRREASIMITLMSHKLDEHNIIKYYGECVMGSRLSLILEVLDINLLDYILNTEHLMRLADIRSVIQQMATALDALKKIGVIHCDVRPENIMLVDHVRQPFRVKLIDFGLAIFSSKAKQGRIHQIPCYRAPEIILGLPFSEAMDIWSLGCVMAIMKYGFMLFPTSNDYHALRYITELLGPVPDHLLDAGLRSKMYFKKTESDEWRLMTNEEYWGDRYHSSDCRSYKFRSLDETVMICPHMLNKTKLYKRRACIELMKEMLHLDGNQRITPSGILNHPFITQSYLNTSSNLCCCDKHLESAEAQPSTSQTQNTTKQTKQETKGGDSCTEPLPSGAVLVQPARPKKRVRFEDTSDLKSKNKPSTRIWSDGSKKALSSTTPDDTEDNEKKKKKKRKNCFTRIYSWMRKKIFGS